MPGAIHSGISPGGLHSTAIPVDSRYFRDTGTDLESIERLRIDAAFGKIQRIFGRQTGAPVAVAR